MEGNPRKKIVLIIVDGFGISSESEGNAILLSKTPTWDFLKDTYPHTSLFASGRHVGLPEGVMGNSEVGHLTIGSGRILFQSLENINQIIASDKLSTNSEVLSIISHLKKTDGDLHLLGLMSDGKVHSDQNHLEALVSIFGDKIKKTWIHCITDGRDTPIDSSPIFIERILHFISSFKRVKLASIVGRYYAMDRDRKWGRTEIAYNLLTKGEGEFSENPIQLIKKRYQDGETDEFLQPIILERAGTIKNGDCILFFNFRPDRARQMTQAFNFNVPFKTVNFEMLKFSTMTEYDDDWEFGTVISRERINNSLAEIISLNKLSQVHIAETEKYAHVTYFLNGGYEDPFSDELRVLIKSLNVATYDLRPEMSTPGITKKSVQLIESNKYDFVVINIACPDMVGHTGNLDATIQAIKALDSALTSIYKSCIKNGYILIITSDHGNAEKMKTEKGIHTAHTTNPVPFLITIKDEELKENCGLKDVAPTILEIFNLKKPKEMTGTSLFK